MRLHGVRVRRFDESRRRSVSSLVRVTRTKQSGTRKRESSNAGRQNVDVPLFIVNESREQGRKRERKKKEEERKKGG